MPCRHMAEWRYSSTLTSALQVSGQCHAMDISSGKIPMPSTRWTEGCVSPSPGLHSVAKIKYLSSVNNQTQIPQLSRPYPCYYTDSTIPAPSSSTKQSIF